MSDDWWAKVMHDLSKAKIGEVVMVPNDVDTRTISYPDNNPKTLTGVTKIPLHLVPPVAIHHEALAFADGATKYGPYNWRDKQVSSSIYYAAAMRHLMAWWDGEELSEDAGVKHLAHARACLAILLDAESINKLNDDRPTKGAASALQKENIKKDVNVRQVSTNPVSASDCQEQVLPMEGGFGQAGDMGRDGGPVHAVCGKANPRDGALYVWENRQFRAL